MSEIKSCVRCHRPIFGPELPTRHALNHGEIVSAVVEHTYYGCDTGCCGHAVWSQDAAGNTCGREFEFVHPGSHEDFRTWATSLAGEHFPGIPLDWEESGVINSC